MHTFSSESLKIHHDGDYESLMYLFDNGDSGIIVTIKDLVDAMSASEETITLTGPDCHVHHSHMVEEVVDGKFRIKSGDYTLATVTVYRSDIHGFLLSGLSSFVIAQVEQLNFDGDRSSETVRDLLSIADTLGNITGETSEIAEALKLIKTV